MSVKFLEGREITNSYHPVPWGWSEVPFPALRGEGQEHKAFLAVARGMTEREVLDNTSKIITTAKGTKLLVPCSESENETILLITAKGGFRAPMRIYAKAGAEIVIQRDSSKHCVTISHVVVRLHDKDSYVMEETGWRTGTGIVELYTHAGVVEMTSEEYKEFENSGWTITDLLYHEYLKKLNITESQANDSLAAKGKTSEYLKSLTDRMDAIHHVYHLHDEAIVVNCSGGGTYLFTRESLEKLEKLVEELEDQHDRFARYDKYAPMFEEECSKRNLPMESCASFSRGYRSFGNVFSCSFYNAETRRYEYTEEGLHEFLEEICEIEKIYREECEKYSAVYNNA